MNRGALLTITEAAKKGGIHRETIRNYIASGCLQTYLDGTMVYYRDVLRASWEVSQQHRATSGKASPKYKKI